MSIMTAGQRMKEKRKELGLSAEFIADKLGVSPATIYRYEKGDIEKIPGNILEQISKILKTTPAYLMGWEPDDASRIRMAREVSGFTQKICPFWKSSVSPCVKYLRDNVCGFNTIIPPPYVPI